MYHMTEISRFMEATYYPDGEVVCSDKYADEQTGSTNSGLATLQARCRPQVLRPGYLLPGFIIWPAGNGLCYRYRVYLDAVQTFRHGRRKWGAVRRTELAELESINKTRLALLAELRRLKLVPGQLAASERAQIERALVELDQCLVAECIRSLVAQEKAVQRLDEIRAAMDREQTLRAIGVGDSVTSLSGPLVQTLLDEARNLADPS